METLAARTGLSSAYICLLENHGRPSPPLTTALSLIQALEVNDEQVELLISLAAQERGLKDGEEGLPEAVQYLLVDARQYAFKLPDRFFKRLSEIIREAAQ